MKFEFKKATKLETKLRLALIGPSGSGKTYWALEIARQLGSKIAVIDTEHGSAARYSDRFDFDSLELDTFAPLTYVGAIEAATGAGYGTVVVDSLSHAWSGKDGALEQVDRNAKRAGNSFAAWRDVTPQHNTMVEALLAVQKHAHLIVTMRSKTEYVLEDDNRGKKVPRKVGMAPIQRDGLEYEFDVVAELNHDHELVITKSRIPALDNAVIKPGAELGEKLRAWLSGEKPEPKREDRKSEPPPAVGEPCFSRKFPDKHWAGQPLSAANGEVLSDYASWLEALIKDPKQAKAHEQARKALDDTAEALDAILASEAAKVPSDDIAEGLQRHIDDRDAGEQQPDGWGLSS